MHLNSMTIAISGEIDTYVKLQGERPTRMEMNLPIYKIWTAELAGSNISGNEYALMEHLKNILSVETTVLESLSGPGIVFYRE